MNVTEIMYLLEKISSIIKTAVTNLNNIVAVDVEIEVPRVKEHGDFATNVAMKLAKSLKQPPMKIAETLVETFQREKPLFQKVEAVPPGFINFWINPAELARTVSQVLTEGEHYGKINLGEGKRVLVEFVSANPTGPLHLGHCRNAVVGDTIARILSAAGYKVEREYYFNDAGAQMQRLGESLRARYLQKLGRPAKLPEDGYQGEYLIEIAEQLISEKGDSLLDNEDWTIFTAYATSRIMKLIQQDLQDLRIEFDHYVNESELMRSGAVESVLAELRSRDMVYEKDGALWLKTAQFGDEKDRVLVKSDGQKTYLAPDIAYHKHKFLRGYDLMINVFGGDHHGYVPRLKAAMQALGFDAAKLHCLIIQMVTLKSGEATARFSKRAGGFVTIRDLLNELGADVVRFFFLMRTIDSQLVFDWDLARSTSMDNPVYYVQYAYARTCSLFNKAHEAGLCLANITNCKVTLLTLPEEQTIIKEMALFPDVIRRSAEALEPQFITAYLQELVAAFHNYFTAGTRDPEYRIILPDNLPLSYSRLALVKALQIVIRNAMNLIAVSTPEKM